MAYACFKKEESVNNIIRDGAAVKTSLYNYLGNYLQRLQWLHWHIRLNLDIQLAMLGTRSLKIMVLFIEVLNFIMY